MSMIADAHPASRLPDAAEPRRDGNEETARRIETMILCGEVQPGERLNELALSRRLGISRAALREAIRGLEQLALVEVVPNRGVVVRQVSMKDALDLYDLRAALFRAAARLVARRALPEALSRLEAANNRMREAAQARRFVDYYAHNLDFHTALMAASGNPPITQAYDKAVKGLHLFRRRALVHPAQLDLSLREHDEMLAAIVAHDAVAAGDAAERHIMLGRDRMLDTLDGVPG
jgi:DNA-binding GntR family transcriptional regulator